MEKRFDAIWEAAQKPDNVDMTGLVYRAVEKSKDPFEVWCYLCEVIITSCIHKIPHGVETGITVDNNGDASVRVGDLTFPLVDFKIEESMDIDSVRIIGKVLINHGADMAEVTKRAVTSGVFKVP